VVIVGGLILLGLGAYFVVVGLDRADKIASVIGAFVGLLGLCLSGYALVLTRRGLPQSPSHRQTVARSTVGGDVLQVRGVGGSVRLGSGTAGTAAEPSRSVHVKDARAADDQLVTDTQIQGHLRQVDDIGGDVEVDR